MKKTLFLLSIGGLLFSGYMSSVKFFTQACAFNEPCPLFLGLPACYFGFALFVVLGIVSGLVFFEHMEQIQGLRIIASASSLGILFSGSFSVRELPVLFSQGFGAYALGLPTCTLGLLFYLIILIVSMKGIFRKTNG